MDVPALTVDFADLDSVRRLADRLLHLAPRIDVLAADAGGVPATAEPTVDGIEPAVQTNAIGPWLLATLLAPAMNWGRLIATSSRTHTTAALPDNLHDILAGTSRLSRQRAYARAKLVAAILLREFGRRHPASRSPTSTPASSRPASPGTSAQPGRS